MDNSFLHSKKLLLVDDEPELLKMVSAILTDEGFQRLVTADNMKEGIAAAKAEKPDLAILDVMLPDADGFQICKKIRETSYYPVIMLTAKAADGDKIMGLTIGADDYITKPFNPLEVVARVKTQLRRYMHYNNPPAKPENRPMNTIFEGLSLTRTITNASCLGENCS